MGWGVHASGCRCQQADLSEDLMRTWFVFRPLESVLPDLGFWSMVYFSFHIIKVHHLIFHHSIAPCLELVLLNSVDKKCMNISRHWGHQLSSQVRCCVHLGQTHSFPPSFSLLSTVVVPLLLSTKHYQSSTAQQFQQWTSEARHICHLTPQCCWRIIEP